MRGSYWFNRDRPKPAKPELKDLVSAANEVAKTARDVLTAMLVVALTLAATMIAATDEALLRDTAEVFPGLGVKVRLSTIFLLAPIVFVFLHANALLQLHLLAGRIRGLNAQMEAQGLDETARRSWRRMIHGFAFAQLLAGEDGHGGAGEKAHRTLLAVMSWLAITAVPVVLLVCTQVSFVRYQSDPITLAHQIVLGADLTLLLWFHFAHWGRVTAWRWASVLWSACALVVTGGLGWLSLSQALPPGPEVEKLGGKMLDKTCRVPGLTWSCRYLDLSGRTLVNNDARPDLLKPFADSDVASKEHQSKMVALDLHGRILRFANFERAQLFAANLRGIQAERSQWYRAVLTGVNLENSSLRNAGLSEASLQGANLAGAWLHSAYLFRASLQGAHLFRAHLPGANLREALLQGAKLSEADLQGALLIEALLQGGDLAKASLQGADLTLASLQGADLDGASFQGADLLMASLQGANLEKVNLAGAFFSGGSYVHLTRGAARACHNAWIIADQNRPYDLGHLRADLENSGLPSGKIGNILNRRASNGVAFCDGAPLPRKTEQTRGWAQARVGAACSHPAAARRLGDWGHAYPTMFLTAWKAETCPAVMAVKRERGEVQ